VTERDDGSTEGPSTQSLTPVMTEGRRLMRLAAELTPEHFRVLLQQYQRLTRDVFEAMGGRDIEVSGDTATAIFDTAREAVLAAVAAQRAIALDHWPNRRTPEISIGVHSSAPGVDSIRAARRVCEDLCDAAEAGEIFLSPTASSLLAHEDLGQLTVRNVGEQQTRRTGRVIHAFALVAPEP
jgi:class 3 adenylate cyclase